MQKILKQKRSVVLEAFFIREQILNKNNRVLNYCQQRSGFKINVNLNKEILLYI